MAVADSVARLIPGVLKAESLAEESFSEGILEYPQYTKPADYHGQKVPEVLLSGNHEAIRQWRAEQALQITRQRRPDLLDRS
jgi:tRNA (guanine37-N1)-methyltransferase